MPTFAVSDVERGGLYESMAAETSVRALLKQPVEALSCSAERLRYLRYHARAVEGRSEGVLRSSSTRDSSGRRLVLYRSRLRYACARERRVTPLALRDTQR